MRVPLFEPQVNSRTFRVLENSEKKFQEAYRLKQGLMILRTDCSIKLSNVMLGRAYLWVETVRSCFAMIG